MSSPWSGKALLAQIAGQAERHDYEPGTVYVKMHTDPLCRICGEPRKRFIHRGEPAE